MINLGSISDQTLAGIVTTASHGSGINYGVLSTHIIGLTLLLADGSRITCSRHENADIFMASICGLGSTGLILTIKLEVEPAFRLREVQETFEFDHVVRYLDRFVFASEHVRLWWFPTTGSLRVSSLDRTHEVRLASPEPIPSNPNLIFPAAQSSGIQLVVAFAAWASFDPAHAVRCPILFGPQYLD
jgi:L-gulonolactone oxidase